MKTMLGILVTLMLAPALAVGEVLTVSPSQAVVLPADGSGLTKVAVQFDLSGLRAAEGRVIDEAYVEWTPSGVSSEELVTFSAYEVTTAWSAASAAQGAPEVSESAAGTWEVDPADYARTGGFVRFNVTAGVSSWASGASANHGLVLVMGQLDDETLASELNQIHLTVRYGFRP